MGRQLVILAIIFFAVVGMASAAASKAPEHALPTIPAAEGPSSGVIGNTDGIEDAAPVGGPVPDGAFSTVATETDSPTGPPTKSAASALQISTFAAATAAAVFFY